MPVQSLNPSDVIVTALDVSATYIHGFTLVLGRNRQRESRISAESRRDFHCVDVHDSSSADDTYKTT